MCFPKFNPAGFVHAYVSYDIEYVGLVFISTNKEALEELRGWKEIVLEVSEIVLWSTQLIPCRNWRRRRLWPRYKLRYLIIHTRFVGVYKI